MFDKEGCQCYLRSKISIERELSEIGDFKGSKEVEYQMQFIEKRLTERIKQAYCHAGQEMDALRMILVESTKD